MSSFNSLRTYIETKRREKQMKKQLLSLTAFAWFLGNAFALSAQAASIVVEDQVTAPTVAVRLPEESLQAGSELKVVNFTQQGIQFKIKDSQISVLVGPSSTAVVKLDQAGEYTYKVYYGIGPGLTSPTVPANLQEKLTVR
jgi:hypothetical protein